MIRVETTAGTYARMAGQVFQRQELLELVGNLDYLYVASYSEFPDLPDFSVDEKNSAVIPVVTDSEEQIAHYKSTTRNEIRKTFRMPEFTVEIDDTPLDELIEFHSSCARERGWKPTVPEELEACLAICVRYKDDLVSGITAYRGRNTIRVARIFNRHRCKTYEHLQQECSWGTRRAIHELTRVAQQEGLEVVDLAGIVLDGDPGKKGIARFKKSFGVEIYPTWVGRYYGPRFESLESYIEKNEFDLA